MILWIFVAASLLQLIIPPLLPPQGSPTNSTTPAGTNTSTPASSTNLSVAPLNVLKVIVSVINIVVGAIGLYGVYKDLHAYLLPFLVWVGIFALQEAITTIIANFIVGVILGELLVLLIFFYFWLVVFSHYRVLKGSVRPIQA